MLLKLCNFSLLLIFLVSSQKIIYYFSIFFLENAFLNAGFKFKLCDIKIKKKEKLKFKTFLQKNCLGFSKAQYQLSYPQIKF